MTDDDDRLPLSSSAFRVAAGDIRYNDIKDYTSKLLLSLQIFC